LALVFRSLGMVSSFALWCFDAAAVDVDELGEHQKRGPLRDASRYWGGRRALLGKP
jgi:hypothetical protein